MVDKGMSSKNLRKIEKHILSRSYLELALWNKPCETSRKGFNDTDLGELNTYKININLGMSQLLSNNAFSHEMQ